MEIVNRKIVITYRSHIPGEAEQAKRDQQTLLDRQSELEKRLGIDFTVGEYLNENRNDETVTLFLSLLLENMLEQNNFAYSIRIDEMMVLMDKIKRQMQPKWTLT